MSAGKVNIPSYTHYPNKKSTQLSPYHISNKKKILKMVFNQGSPPKDVKT